MRHTATITLSSHGFRVTDFNSEFAGHLMQFCRRFILHKMESKVVQGRRTLVKIPDRVFASATKDRKELRFHINCYEDFKNFMRNCGYNTDRFKIVQLEVPEGKKALFEFAMDGIAPREHQVEWLGLPARPQPDGSEHKDQHLANWQGEDLLCDLPDGEDAKADCDYLNAQIH